MYVVGNQFYITSFNYLYICRMYNVQVVASNIKKARLYRNYSQDYLAYKLNISQNAYSKVELGITKVTIDRLVKIAAVLEIDVTRLLATPDVSKDVAAIGRIQIVPKLLEVVCRATGMGFAAIARVTEDQWITCGVRDEILFGLTPGDELKLETTICNEIRQTHLTVAIDNVDKDEIFCGHPTPAMYGFKSYISVPIFRKDGSFFGTLCAIDPKPRNVNNSQTIGMFTLYAELISFHLNSQELLDMSEASLHEERKTAELRDQFIAILGHDLRNPIGAILNSAQVLQKIQFDERGLKFLKIIQDSSFRMKGLIENILDFARGRLGDGIKLNYDDGEPLEEILNHVITEVKLIWPNREIETLIDLPLPVYCDTRHIAQLFSNLLGNAFTHGNKDSPVIVKISSGKGGFLLSVANAGKKIPEAAMARLFQPFSRGEVKPGQEGLGLGLFISSEIARAHRGTLDVISTDDETIFTFHMPLNADSEKH
ncbi:MAG: ATP-binding region ATPase domain protein [Mucilaginibacter sp.]|nr:ATP-binding region ATPase domain protein [Mucilaginibacter sp.]